MTKQKSPQYLQPSFSQSYRLFYLIVQVFLILSAVYSFEGKKISMIFTLTKILRSDWSEGKHLLETLKNFYSTYYNSPAWEAGRENFCKIYL